MISLVSIHAPREGCDLRVFFLWEGLPSFNSRTPGGVRRKCQSAKTNLQGFNSRTPGGVRPYPEDVKYHTRRFQFTHPGRGATVGTQQGKDINYVSIHAPREGCDSTLTANSRHKLTSFNSRTPGGVRRELTFTSILTSEFQFTHPGRGATSYTQRNEERNQVSIHAPREGCDD